MFLNTDLVVWLSEAAAPTSSEEVVSAPHVEIASPTRPWVQNYLVPRRRSSREDPVGDHLVSADP